MSAWNEIGSSSLPLWRAMTLTRAGTKTCSRELPAKRGRIQAARWKQNTSCGSESVIAPTSRLWPTSGHQEGDRRETDRVPSDSR